jgi:hypothetical protein
VASSVTISYPTGVTVPGGGSFCAWGSSSGCTPSGATVTWTAGGGGTANLVAFGTFGTGR